VTNPSAPGAFAKIRLFLALEAVAFAAAALVHFGWLLPGYRHRPAGTAESVIGAVLLAASVLTRITSRRARGIALVAQTFALAGTLVGAFTIAIGVGPRTVPDVIYHASILIVLAGGLAVMARQRSGGAE
jgi:hypothetical protein